MLHALVYPSLEVGNLSKLTGALKSVDPTLESFRHELAAVSVHFMNKKMYNVAYIFQDLFQVLSSYLWQNCLRFWFCGTIASSLIDNIRVMLIA